MIAAGLQCSPAHAADGEECFLGDRAGFGRYFDGECIEAGAAYRAMERAARSTEGDRCAAGTGVMRAGKCVYAPPMLVHAPGKSRKPKGGLDCRTRGRSDPDGGSYVHDLRTRCVLPPRSGP